MKRLPLNVLTALLTFLAGAALALSYEATVLLAFLIAAGVPVVVAGLVLYQGLIRGLDWHPAVGKASLGLIFWFMPSTPVLIVGLLVILFPTPPGLAARPDALGQSVLMALTAAYGLAGFGLCRWVGRYEREEHWLLRGGPCVR